MPKYGDYYTKKGADQQTERTKRLGKKVRKHKSLTGKVAKDVKQMRDRYKNLDWM